MLLSIHLLNFFLRLGAPTATLTLVITVARSIDLLSDPAVGWATDGNVLRMCGPCRFPRGVRRKPFMLLGAPFYNLFLVLLLGTPFEFEGTGWGERPARHAPCTVRCLLPIQRCSEPSAAPRCPHDSLCGGWASRTNRCSAS